MPPFQAASSAVLDALIQFARSTEDGTGAVSAPQVVEKACRAKHCPQFCVPFHGKIYVETALKVWEDLGVISYDEERTSLKFTTKQLFDLCSMNVTNLRARARAAGLSGEGDKQEIIDRLIKHGRGEVVRGRAHKTRKSSSSAALPSQRSPKRGAASSTDAASETKCLNDPAEESKRTYVRNDKAGLAQPLLKTQRNGGNCS